MKGSWWGCDVVRKLDKSNKVHTKLIYEARQVMAGGCLIYYKYFEDIAKKNGFKVLLSIHMKKKYIMIMVKLNSLKYLLLT